MDEWTPAKRPVRKSAYEIATIFRRYSTKAHVTSSATVRRRRKQISFTAPQEQSLGGSGVSAYEHLDFDRDIIPEEFDYNEEDEGSERPEALINSEYVYTQACKTLQLVPNSIITRNICLTTLDLRDQLMGSQGVRALCIALMKNTTVTSLNLMGNNMGIQGSSYVAQVLRENPFIRELNLANNGLGKQGVKYLVNAMRDSDVITSLNLSGNNLKENDGVIIRNLIEECKRLKVLNVSHNYFRETGGVEIGDAIGGLNSLEVLDLSWNHLRRYGACAIARGVGNSNSLREVNLSWNGFHLDGGKEMGKALEKSVSLRVLDLSGNRIDETCLSNLINGLKNNSTLMVLKLAHNPLTTNGVHFLLQTLCNLNMSGLTELNLGDLCVEAKSLQLLKMLSTERDIKIKYGAILGQDVDMRNYEQELLDEDPLMILYQYGYFAGLSLMNLFILMSNKDENFTIAAIKRGLQKVDIPLTEKSVAKFAACILDLSDVKQLTEYIKIATDFQNSIRRSSDEVYKRMLHRKLEQTEENRVRAKLKRLIYQQDEQKQEERIKKCSRFVQLLTSVKSTTEGFKDKIKLLADEESIILSPPREDKSFPH